MISNLTIINFQILDFFSFLFNALDSNIVYEFLNDHRTRLKQIFIWCIHLQMYICKAHPECATALFKYMHTIRLGAGRSINLGRHEYDIQFRLKK